MATRHACQPEAKDCRPRCLQESARRRKFHPAGVSRRVSRFHTVSPWPSRIKWTFRGDGSHGSLATDYTDRTEGIVYDLCKTMLPSVIGHADWSADPKKRWICTATLEADAYRVESPACRRRSNPPPSRDAPR